MSEGGLLARPEPEPNPGDEGRRCLECAFFEDHAESSETPRSGEGWCHRYAPKPLEGGSGSGWSGYEWPAARKVDWCGEFVRWVSPEEGAPS